ncbi:MAG: hypothetical protein D6766_07665 [Verrucomicrobia bacterium]|nr:MAG: hypothetical protein D6766_07665 [Verrucomicrobiota bacterium]
MALVVITALQQRARRKLVQRIPDRELSIISHWEQAEFTGLAELLRHPEILDDIATTNRTPITSRQSRALKDSILAGLVAFSRGSYEDFKAFVCPVPLPLTTNRLESMRRFLRDPFAFPTIGRKPEIREPRSIMRILDHGTPEEVHRAYFRVMSAYTDYKDY